MKLIVFIERDGRTTNSLLLTNDATGVYCTPRAREMMLSEMERVGAICKRCHLIARSDELVDGKCGPQLGCTADVDVELLDAGAGPAASKLFHDLWATFIRSVPRDVEETGPEPEKGPTW